MPQIAVRFNNEVHGRVLNAANAENSSMSDYVRRGVMHLLDGCQAPSNNGNHGEFVSHLREQVEQKDTQIQELHQLFAIAQNSLADTTKQLQDHRGRVWWHFWSRG